MSGFATSGDDQVGKMLDQQFSTPEEAAEFDRRNQRDPEELLAAVLRQEVPSLGAPRMMTLPPLETPEQIEQEVEEARRRVQKDGFRFHLERGGGYPSITVVEED